MQFTALFTLLTLLAAPALTDARDHHAGGNGRRHHHALNAKYITREQEHARNVENIAAQVDRREQLAAQHPRALSEKPIRKVKRGAAGCRVKGQNYTVSSTTTTASTTTSAVITTTSSTADDSAATTTTSSSDDGDASPTSTDSGSAGNAGGIAAVQTGGNGDEDSSPSPSSSSAALAATSSAPASNNGGGSNGWPINGIKAGAAMDDLAGLLGSHASWLWNYTPDPYGGAAASQTFVPCVWGDAHLGGIDATRWAEFLAFTTAPQNLIGFYEPDCSPMMSSDIDPSTGASSWNQYIVPYRNQGTTLLSPGMCKQMDETWLGEFLSAGAAMWDLTTIHINKNTLQGAIDDINYYANKYGKPIVVTEFACVDDQNGFTPSNDQGEINNFINQVVQYFESDSRVVGYAMSSGQGLSDLWSPVVNGALSASGQTYLNAISNYH